MQARAAALRLQQVSQAAEAKEAALRQQLVEKAEQVAATERKLAALTAASAESEAARAAELASLRAAAASATSAEDRLARLRGDESALAAMTRAELEEQRQLLEGGLAATTARIHLAATAERLQPDLVCPITQEIMQDPVVSPRPSLLVFGLTTWPVTELVRPTCSCLLGFGCGRV